MLSEWVSGIIITHWMALLAGVLGLAMRISRVPLPNGGAEPRSLGVHVWRLTRVWIEATSSAFMFSLFASIAMVIKVDLLDTKASPMLLAVAVFLGAAASDLWARWATNPTKIPDDIATAVGALVDVWRRFKGDGPSEPP